MRRISMKAALLFCALVGVSVSSCNWSPAPLPPPVAPPVVKAVPPPVVVAQEPPPVENDAGPAADVAPAVEVPAVAPPPPPTFGTERILLLAPTNPVIIELQLSIDGQPHTDALKKLVADVMQLADADGDNRVTWKELCANKRLKYGQFGNLAIEGDNSEKQILERYDIDRDGIVDDTELPRFLTRNAGGSRPFSIRGTADSRDTNRRAAPTWQVLDADGDGAISKSEMAAAAGRLMRLDSNDDEILLPADLDPRLQTGDPTMMADRSRRRGHDAARLLGPHADWGTVQMAMEREYGGTGLLREGCFPLTPDLFAKLDANGDGRLGRTEFAALNDVPPHLVVGVEFGSPAAEKPAIELEEWEVTELPAELPEPVQREPRLKIVSVSPALGGESPQVMEQPGRMTILIGGVLLTLYTNDTVASEDFAERARQALAMYDNNKDGYLVKDEVPEALQAQFGRLEAIDTNDDGKAYPEEIETYLAQQQAGLRAQIHAKAGDREDVLFACLDADRDQRLDSREMDSAAQRLLALDKNNDGVVTADELPELMIVGLARGSLENADATFRPPPVVVRSPAGDAPRWFTAMDANADGAISRREFVGPAEKFAELDKDGNGLLELNEAIKP